MTPPSPSLSPSSIRCLLVAMVTSPSVPPYGEAGRLEDILDRKKKEGRQRREREREEKQERYSKDDIIGYGMVATGSVCVCVFL